MTLVMDESEYVSVELLSPILATVRKDIKAIIIFCLILFNSLLFILILYYLLTCFIVCSRMCHLFVGGWERKL